MESRLGAGGDGRPAVVSVDGVYKTYGDNPVLRGLTVDLREGEVLALAGENGAGKSTLLKIIAGLVVPDAGTVTLGGTGIPPGNVHAARQAGIAIVPQELAPVPDMTVYENLFLGREPRSRWGVLDRPAMIRAAAEMLSDFRVEVSPRATMRHLSTANQQLIEIIKSASIGAQVLLLDEPTSAIAQREVERLYELVDDLRSRGVAMVYTTHKMAEIRALADRVVVLRDGALIEDRHASEISDEEIVTAMIGRVLGDLYPEASTPEDPREVLVVRDLVLEPGGQPLSLTVHAGEIVALAGLLGAGRTELIEAIFGVRPAVSGDVVIDGRVFDRRNPSRAIARGLALVPEDRKAGGAVLSMSILRNGILPRLSRFSRLGWVQWRSAARDVGQVMDRVQLRYTSLNQDVGHLSGGNQQKVVMARWLTDRLGALLLDEPTRGVDVGARSEIYRLIVELAREHGVGILMASSDMAELIGLAHRIIVIRGGVAVASFDRRDHPDAEALQELVFRKAAGIVSATESGGTGGH